MAIILIYDFTDHVRFKDIGIELTISKKTQVEAMVKTEHVCNLNWHIYLIMGLILGIPFWLILGKIKTI